VPSPRKGWTLLTGALAVAGAVFALSPLARDEPRAAVPAGWLVPSTVPLPAGGRFSTSALPGGRKRLTAYDRLGVEVWFAERGPSGIDRIEGRPVGRAADGRDDVIWSIDY